jgi:hypothetical protein
LGNERCSLRSIREQHNRQRLVRLTHQERGGGRYLISETNDADLEPSAKQVGSSAQINERR